MRLDKIFNLLIISFLLASCSEEVPAYREIWQKAHHLDDARMVEFYGEPGKDKDNMLGAILEAVDGNWGKVADLTEGSRPSDIYAYYHNLAMAMEGRLADIPSKTSGSDQNFFLRKNLLILAFVFLRKHCPKRPFFYVFLPTKPPFYKPHFPEVTPVQKSCCFSFCNTASHIDITMFH